MVNHRWGRLWGWLWRATGHGGDASNGESNEGEEAGELHFERLYKAFGNDLFCCLIVVLVVVLECLLMRIKAGEAVPFIDKTDKGLAGAKMENA